MRNDDDLTMEQRYPAWRYHATLPAHIVETEAEDKALGKGWVDNPAKVKLQEAVPEPEPTPLSAGLDSDEARRRKARG